MKNLVEKSSLYLQIHQGNDYSKIETTEIDEGLVEEILEPILEKYNPKEKHNVTAAYLEIKIKLNPERVTEDINDLFMDHFIRECNEQLEHIGNYPYDAVPYECIKQLAILRNSILERYNSNWDSGHLFEFMDILKSIYNLENKVAEAVNKNKEKNQKYSYRKSISK